MIHRFWKRIYSVKQSCPLTFKWNIVEKKRAPSRYIYFGFTKRSNSTYKISYMTDVEGDALYFKNFVNISSVLDYDNASDQVVMCNRNDHFVFGGDISDKGGSDLYVMRHLLSLKERYPNNVHFILGNRDINKMRIIQEIGYKRHKGCYWLKGSGKIGDPLIGNVPLDGVSTLKWMLQGTMGCPETFELRREELQQELGKSNISDEKVLESFVETCHPFGPLGRYLSSAKLALQIGKTLFVHGALPITDEVINNVKDDPSSLWDDFNFAMPWNEDNGYKPKIKFDEWMIQLNTFAEEEIQSWISKYTQKPEKLTYSSIWAPQGGYRCSSAGGSLMQYGMCQLSIILLKLTKFAF